MILLDTDHLTVLKYHDSERAKQLTTRLATASAIGESIGVTVIGVEEQMRGWMSAIAKERNPLRMVGPYRELASLFDFFRGFHLALFTEAAAEIFSGFSAIRIKSTDRKVAAIALANRALLLTANRRDFEQIPGLKIENWLAG